MSGLIHPTDLDAWHAWSRRRPLTVARTLLQRNHPPTTSPVVFRNSTDQPLVVVAISSSSPSARAALLAPLSWLGSTSAAVVSEVDLSSYLPGWSRESANWPRLIEGARAVVGDGNFLDHGHNVWAESVRHQIPYYVSQHGALTPFAPPLPSGVHLLAWSSADGDFWRSGRGDVVAHEAGSQLLWEAVSTRGTSASIEPELMTYLGQGHSAEIGRTRMIEAALRFCRVNEATYRPHPSEKDKVSRLAFTGFERAGIPVDARRPLNELTGPVVSVFSTGVLEAAAQGRDAWVDFPRPPTWLSEFWERYGMRRYGGPATLAPTHPGIEPAQRIAQILLGAEPG